MWYIIALVALLLVGLFDGHLSSVTALFFIYLLGLWSIYSIRSKVERKNGAKVFGIVFSVFVISAFIASRSFLDGKFFYVSDSMRYIEDYGRVNTWSWGNVYSNLIQTYVYFIDDNGLFNNALAFWAYVANNFIDGTSVLYLTLLETLFGVLASLEVYKISSLYFIPSKAAKYSFVFAILSVFHIYSVVIIRDIVITYFYLLGLRKILEKPKLSDIFLLVFVLIITMGIRLYTGLFFGTFIMLWLYILIREKKYAQYRIIVVPIILVGIAFVGASIASSVLIDNTIGQISEYDEFYADESGVVSRLRELPIGVRHISILLFSQLPLSSFHRLMTSTSFSNYYISILVLIYQFFGYVIFYGFLYFCFIKNHIKKMAFTEKWLLIILLVFVAITQSTHIDVRRSMAAVPFFYLLYIYFYEKKHREWRNVNFALIVVGVMIVSAYAILK